jgi:1,4-alpha-glucan branching enzyme
MDSSTAAGYARKRFGEHIMRFNNLYHAIMSGNIPEKWLKEIEEKDSIFQDVDYRVFRNEK